MSFFSNLFTPHRVYLDYAAATPTDPSVILSMREALSSLLYFGNPSSTHEEGRRAKEMLEGARLKVARLLKTHADEIVFTSGATESNNLAIQGVVAASRLKTPHIITTSIEHPSIRDTVAALERGGVAVTYLEVDENGIISLKDLEKALKKETILVTLSFGNSEIGTLQTGREIGRMVKSFREKNRGEGPLLHVDVSQAINYVSAHPEVLCADLLSLDGPKLYGPKGVGLLYVKRGVTLKPIVFGGGQERGVRAGTENVSGAVGIARALEITLEKREGESSRLKTLSDLFISLLKAKVPDVVINGADAPRLPNFVNICIPRLDAEFAVVKLDTLGIAVSSASACRTLTGDSRSYVIAALPRRESCTSSSIRFTLGRFSSKSDIERAVDAVSRLSR